MHVEQISKQEQKHCLIARSRLNVNPNLTKENECILLALNITVSKVYVNRAKKYFLHIFFYMHKMLKDEMLTTIHSSIKLLNQH